MLVSERFAGDPVLEACANGTHRMLPPETGPAVGKVQQALIELGFPLPAAGVDSSFGSDTASAVTAFKQAQGIVPSDGVVGRKTMAALDSFFAELVVPLPPPEPEFGADPFGRRPAAEAKVPAALELVEAFRANPAGSNWLHLDRATVAGGIERLVKAPDLTEQGGNGLCTSAAFVNVWAQDAPDAFATFATTLFDTRAASIAGPTGGGLRITASRSLLAADYASIAARMKARGFPVPGQADWMILSALRDSSNLVVDFTGDPDDWISHNLGDGGFVGGGDLEEWMRKTGVFVAVVNEMNALVTKSADHARSLDPRRSRCVLHIDARMLTDKKGMHDAVLRSPITQNGDTTYDLRLWTWGGVHPLHLTRERFEDNYYGACIGFF